MEQHTCAAITRIGRMELLFDFISNLLRNAPDELRSPAAVEAVELLSAYYESGDWLHDYELNEQRLLPSGLKRGVLSQDGLYELLCEIREETPRQ